MMRLVVVLFLLHSQVDQSKAFFVKTRLGQDPKRGTLTDPVNFSSSSLTSRVYDHDEDYAEFLDVKDRRHAILRCSTFDGLAPIDLERLVHVMKRVPVPSGHKVVTQGEAADDGVFFVASGTFECYDEPTESVKATLHQYDVFGELALLLNQKRALSVRASSPDASVWNIDGKDFVKVVSGQTKVAAVDALNDQEAYADFLEQRSRLKALRSCPIMRNLADSDANAVLQVMKKLDLSEDELIIEQGSDGDSMYFVVDGAFECFQHETGKVLKVCEKGDFFGELALFFQTPRRLSVKATKPSTVLELCRDDFFNAVQETSIDEEALGALRNAYQTQGSVNLDEIYQLLVVKSRPAKKPVSFHSTFSIFSAAVFVTAFLPFFKPGLDDRGLPTIFRIVDHISPASTLQMQVACWMFAISGVLGLLRFPPNTPISRKLAFESAASADLFQAAYASSSLNGQAESCWWFDAFSTPGTASLVLSGLLMSISALRLLDDAIAGHSRGRNTIPGAHTPLLAIITYSMVCFLALFAIAPVIPVLTSDSTSYEASLTNIFIENGIDGFLVAVTSCAAGFAAFSSLVATLQFEKKIASATGSVIVLMLLVVMSFDFAIFSFSLLAHPVVLGPNVAATREYILTQFSQAHFFEVTASCVVVVVLNALRRRGTDHQ